MQLRDTGSDEHSSSQPASTKLRPYQSPVLAEYGQVSKLTQGGGVSVPDGVSSRMNSMGP
jgi:hypothetical protein